MAGSSRLRCFGWLGAAALALALTACNTSQPAGEQMSDASITAKVKSKFATDPDVSALNIDVDTQEGVVYLIGRVNSDAERREAQRLAEETHGVRSVKNLLEIVEHSGEQR
jgi:hyperosmotically inducible periplasmic protein